MGFLTVTDTQIPTQPSSRFSFIHPFPRLDVITRVWTQGERVLSAEFENAAGVALVVRSPANSRGLWLEPATSTVVSASAVNRSRRVSPTSR